MIDKMIDTVKGLMKKYKEVIFYLIFGVLTTIINIVSYWLFTNVFKIDYMVSNVIAWILSVLFAFVTNKIFVFESKSKNKKDIVVEATSFFLARIFSLGIDMIIMYVGVSLINIDDLIIKILANVIVIIVNYFLSKFIIFNKKSKV